MRNALADLTKAASPLAVGRRLSVNGGTIRVARHRDPRVTGVRVYRRPGRGSVVPGARGVKVVCASRSSRCDDRTALPRRTYTYGATVVDRWGQSTVTHAEAIVCTGPCARPQPRR
jgi:hypothetical protein